MCECVMNAKQQHTTQVHIALLYYHTYIGTLVTDAKMAFRNFSHFPIKCIRFLSRSALLITRCGSIYIHTRRETKQ